MKEVAKSDEVKSHVWHEEGDFIVSCTNTGKIIVSNLLKSEVNQKMHFPEAVFVHLQIMKFGLVAVTQNSTFYVFTSEVVKKMEKFNLLTKWTP